MVGFSLSYSLGKNILSSSYLVYLIVYGVMKQVISRAFMGIRINITDRPTEIRFGTNASGGMPFGSIFAQVKLPKL